MTDEEPDPRSSGDELRARCPVALGPDGTWTVVGHAAVTEAALDDVTFSNHVSRHLQVPNGLDGDEHTAFRAVVDRYFTPQRMAGLRPVVAQVAHDLVAGLTLPAALDAVGLGSTFAVRAQCAWLGWPAGLEDTLVAWVHDNREATRSRDGQRTAAVARRFDDVVRSLTEPRLARGPDAAADVTTELAHDEVDGRRLTTAEVVSILRNWTGGDLASMALCVGVVLTYLADDPGLQAHLREGVDDDELDAVLDEILRIDDPFVANRRVTTAPTTLAGRAIRAGEPVVLHWTAANRDPSVVGDPDRFDPVGHRPHNLVWGIGRHVCPGRPLATLELRELTRAVLAATAAIEPDPDSPRVRERMPAGGYAVAPIVLR